MSSEKASSLPGPLSSGNLDTPAASLVSRPDLSANDSSFRSPTGWKADLVSLSSPMKAG